MLPRVKYNNNDDGDHDDDDDTEDGNIFAALAQWMCAIVPFG